jgi:hypothetical protein
MIEIDINIENILTSNREHDSINIDKQTLSFSTVMLEKKYKIFILKKFLLKSKI